MMDGNVYSFGDGTQGQIGNGQIQYKQRELLKVEVPEDMKHVSAGYWHTMGVTEKGNLYVWGSGTFGKLGLGNENMNVLQPQKLDQLQRATKIQIVKLRNATKKLERDIKKSPEQSQEDIKDGEEEKKEGDEEVVEVEIKEDAQD